MRTPKPPRPRPPLTTLIVLGARLNPQGEPGRVARVRLLHALHIWRQLKPTCRLLITGGPTPGAAISEARSMAAWSLDWAAQNWGPELREELAACLILEEASQNTAASAANTLPLARGLGVKAVGLVSDRFHMRRACYLFRRHYKRHGIEIQPLPAAGLVSHYWGQRRYLRLARMALREGGAWLKLFGGLALRLGRRKGRA